MKKFLFYTIFFMVVMSYGKDIINNTLNKIETNKTAINSAVEMLEKNKK